MPKEKDKRELLQQSIIADISESGFNTLWAREVPYAFHQCGRGAQKVMPSFVQLFIEKPRGILSERAFEDQLYRLRRVLEKNYSSEEMTIVAYQVKPSFTKVCYMRIK